ncbi:MAG: hypothetical protein DMG76_24235 [Acidobacteria bacterium]|nr:MAG: hypothetical protein DMG76_24235 [Acidobacteriota bacterium]
MKMRSTSSFPAVLSIVLVFATHGFAQEHPAITAQANTVYVGADGKYEAAPDTALIQFGLSVQEGKAQAAYEHASRDAEQVRQILRANGVDPKAANLGFFSTQPVYDWKNPTRRQVAVRVNTDVTLKLKDFSKIGSITEQLTDARISESLSVNYTLDNLDDAKSKAVEDAYRRARASADTLARASGRALGELSYASVDTFENPRPVPRMSRPMAMRAEAAPAPTEEFTPQNVTVTAHVNALFNLK